MGEAEDRRESLLLGGILFMPVRRELQNAISYLIN